jgi:hypothetical protein
MDAQMDEAALERLEAEIEVEEKAIADLSYRARTTGGRGGVLATTSGDQRPAAGRRRPRAGVRRSVYRPGGWLAPGRNSLGNWGLPGGRTSVSPSRNTTLARVMTAERRLGELQRERQRSEGRYEAARLALEESFSTRALVLPPVPVPLAHLRRGPLVAWACVGGLAAVLLLLALGG